MIWFVNGLLRINGSCKKVSCLMPRYGKQYFIGSYGDTITIHLLMNDRIITQLINRLPPNLFSDVHEYIATVVFVQMNKTCVIFCSHIFIFLISDDTYECTKVIFMIMTSKLYSLSNYWKIEDKVYVGSLLAYFDRGDIPTWNAGIRVPLTCKLVLVVVQLIFFLIIIQSGYF